MFKTNISRLGIIILSLELCLRNKWCRRRFLVCLSVSDSVPVSLFGSSSGLSWELQPIYMLYSVFIASSTWPSITRISIFLHVTDTKIAQNVLAVWTVLHRVFNNFVITYHTNSTGLKSSTVTFKRQMITNKKRNEWHSLAV